ncbi:MAG: chemotaxis response regulator protein-glutamate methylesterase [Rhodospirillales bacterium]|nr:chemotaxis response regulator protein-glutamate methylesterase [Rhodospirillales bacterium]MCB9997140.1 chemotaxis response regulator protein-glutamate methylesterase [Rhodospirillales bacterium]
MVVDDSAAIRAIVKRILSESPDIEICGTALHGAQAIESVARLAPDVIVLDIEMPVMDGITALPKILEQKKDVKIIMCSTLSDRGADISIKALSMGAADCILKPTGATAIQADVGFGQSLIRMVLSLGTAHIKKVSGVQPERQPIQYRPAPAKIQPRILAIGSSTGGPNALIKVLSGLKGIKVPIVITQHMPEKFTKILAEQLSKNTGLPCVEAEEGMSLQPGNAYVAPGGYHMLLKKSGLTTAVHLDKGPLENFCRPSVDPMLRSLIPIYGSHIFVTILTGMGNDGLAGCQDIVKNGGHVIAQDEATSVVWGMPGAVAKAGICTAVLPDANIAGHIMNVFSGSGSASPVSVQRG